VDSLHGVRVSMRGAVFFLAVEMGGSGCRRANRQDGCRIFCGKVEDAMRDRNFLVGGQGHAFFVDGECDYACAVALGHGQDFTGALFAVFEVDRVDNGFAGMRFSASSTRRLRCCR